MSLPTHSGTASQVIFLKQDVILNIFRHVHHASEGGGQILVCVAGRGYYQEWGKDAIEMKPGCCVNIPSGMKHWHGAAPDTWFSHLAIEVPGKDGSSEWLEPVTDGQYGMLK